MSRASIKTLLPLDRFARIIGYSPILFGQVYISGEDLQPVTACSDPVLQYTWQPRSGGAPGREEIAGAIQQAELIMTQLLNYSPLPVWYTDVDSRITRVTPGALSRQASGYNPYQEVIIAPYGNKYIIQGGQEAWSLIQAAVPVVYSDTDNDGYKDLATITVATTIVDANEISVYYSSVNHDPAWEIRPIKVSISAGTAVITFSRHQAVMPDLLESLNAAGVDGLVDANFLTTVDVYRHYNNPSAMATAEWSPPICSDAVGEVSAQSGALTVLDSRNGIVGLSAGTWNTVTGGYDYAAPAWWRTPDRVRLWFRAGYRGQGVQRSMWDMDPQLERSVAYLALSYLDREWLACEQLRNLQAHWRQDLAVRQSGADGSTSFQFPSKLLDNPFGTTRAAIYAWRIVQQLMVGEAVVAS